MKQNTLYKVIPVAAVFLLLASCSPNDIPGIEPQQSDDPKAIRFEIAVSTATAIPSVMQTRVATDDSYNCTFKDGDEIGVYIVKGNGGLQASGNWVDNMKMSYNNAGWTYTLPVDREYYPIGETLNFYAYYPYQDNIDPLNMPFSIQTDQRMEGFEKSYLLTATKTDISNSAAPVRLEFSHTLAMVELAVTSGGDGAKMTDMVEVTLEGCKTQLAINLATGAAAVSGTTASIKMYRIEQPADDDYMTNYTYRALVPAQDMAPNAELFKFTQGVRSLSHKPTMQVALSPGQVKPYNITLQSNLAPDHLYDLYDIYPYKGLPIGVVFNISNGGKNGKIIHLFESMLSWAWRSDYTGARSQVDGQENMDAIKSLEPDFSGYPGFKWCADIGNNWYYPACNEVDNFMFHKDQLNSVLISIGGTELATSAVGSLYGSSTEYDNNQVLAIRVIDRGRMPLSKNSTCPVRAVRKF